LTSYSMPSNIFGWKAKTFFEIETHWKEWEPKMSYVCLSCPNCLVNHVD